MQAAGNIQVEDGLQDGVVRINGEAIDAEAMSACRRFGIFENWIRQDNISNHKLKTLSKLVCPWPVFGGSEIDKSSRFVVRYAMGRLSRAGWAHDMHVRSKAMVQ